jgi:hypothetical protein
MQTGIHYGEALMQVSDERHIREERGGRCVLGRLRRNASHFDTPACVVPRHCIFDEPGEPGCAPCGSRNQSGDRVFGRGWHGQG